MSTKRKFTVVRTIYDDLYDTVQSYPSATAFYEGVRGLTQDALFITPVRTPDDAITVMAFIKAIIELSNTKRIAIVLHDYSLFKCIEYVAKKEHAPVQINPKKLESGNANIYYAYALADLAVEESKDFTLVLAPPAPALALASHGLAPGLHNIIQSCEKLLMISPFKLPADMMLNLRTLRKLSKGVPTFADDKKAPETPLLTAVKDGVYFERQYETDFMTGVGHALASLPPSSVFGVARSIEEIVYFFEHLRKVGNDMGQFNDKQPLMQRRDFLEYLRRSPRYAFWSEAWATAASGGMPTTSTTTNVVIVTHDDITNDKSHKSIFYELKCVGIQVIGFKYYNFNRSEFKGNNVIHLLTYNTRAGRPAAGPLTDELIQALPAAPAACAAVICSTDAPLPLLASMNNRWFTNAPATKKESISDIVADPKGFNGVPYLIATTSQVRFQKMRRFVPTMDSPASERHHNTSTVSHPYSFTAGASVGQELVVVNDENGVADNTQLQSDDIWGIPKNIMDKLNKPAKVFSIDDSDSEDDAPRPAKRTQKTAASSADRPAGRIIGTAAPRAPGQSMTNPEKQRRQRLMDANNNDYILPATPVISEMGLWILPK